MKKAGRILALSLDVAILCGIFAGCKTQVDTPKQQQSGPSSSEKPYQDKITFTISAVDSEKAGVNADGTPAANFQWLKNKFNIEYEYWPLTWSNYVDQTRVWLNAGSAPDIMMLDVSASRYNEYLDWVKAGLFRPYDLDSHENLSATLKTMPTAEKYKVDGKLYVWPSVSDLAQYDFYQPSGYLYRKDWAKAVGAYKEGDVYTWDEWWKLVEAVIKQNPGKNGAGKTIGVLTGSDWAFPKYVTGLISPYMVTFQKKSDGKWVWGPTLPESADAVAKAKELYDKGLIWANQPMAKADDAKNNMAAGTLFASTITNVGVSSWLADYAQPFEKANTGIKAEDAIGFAMVKAPDGKFVSWQGTDHWSETAMNKKISEKQAARWQDILDFLISKDGQNFVNYGIPGTDWEYQDGKVVDKWKTDASGVKVSPVPNASTWEWRRPAFTNDGFQMLNPANPAYMRTVVADAYKRVGDKSQTTQIPMDPDFSYYTSPTYASATTGLEKAVYNEIASLMTSKDIQADWKAWVDQKAKEIQPAIDDLNNNVK